MSKRLLAVVLATPGCGSGGVRGEDVLHRVGLVHLLGGHRRGGRHGVGHGRGIDLKK